MLSSHCLQPINEKISNRFYPITHLKSNVFYLRSFHISDSSWKIPMRRTIVKRRRNANGDVVESTNSSNSSRSSKKGKMRLPDTTDVTKALVTGLLPRSVTGALQETKYHDVILQTSDNHKIPALKAILAIRSPFFATLLYGPFAESASKTVSIDLTQRSLTQILHFIYSDDSPTLRRIDNAIRKAGHGFKARRSAWGSLRCRDIQAAVDVIAAADYCQMQTLTKWGCGLILKAVRVKQGLACIALQAIVDRGGVCDQLADVREKLFEYIVRYIPGCFAVPFKSEDKPLAARECFGHAGKCGVMHLGENAFKMVFARLKQSDSEWRCTAIIFYCIYFWATGGRLLVSPMLGDEDGEGKKEAGGGKQRKDEQTEKRADNDTGIERSGKVQNADPGNVVGDPMVKQTSSRRMKEVDKQSPRWKTAMACAEMAQAPTSEFLVTFMEPSGLLSPDALLRFYRDVTTRNFALKNKARLRLPTEAE